MNFDELRPKMILALKPFTGLPFEDLQFHDMRYAKIEHINKAGKDGHSFLTFSEDLNFNKDTNGSYSNDWILRNWIKYNPLEEPFVLEPYVSRLSKVD